MRPIRVAYLINQYPATSHSFIRREIRAVEASGVGVERFSIRKPAVAELVDPADIEEASRTRSLLDGGAITLVVAALVELATNPLRWLGAMRTAICLGRRSERGVLRHLAYLAEACVLRRAMRTAGITHVHAHFGTNPASVAMLAAALGGAGFSFTVHGAADFDRITTIGIDHKLAAARFAVAVSRYGRGQLCRYAPVDAWPKIHVVHCGVDGDYLTIPPSPVPDDPRFVCVARLSGEKGHLVLLEAAERLAKSGRRFTLALLGDGPLRAMLERKVADAGLSDHVEFHGWADNAAVRTQLARCRALIVPSFMEGLPVVIMEAFALGRPAIASAVAGIPELVRPGETGWLFPVGDPDALAAAMTAALDAPADRLTAMGRAGGDLVRTEFDADSQAALLADLFRNTQATPA